MQKSGTPPPSFLRLWLIFEFIKVYFNVIKYSRPQTVSHGKAARINALLPIGQQELVLI